jgi:lipoprotein-anchoring transpeptidase ErfK/SrfK
MSHMESNTVPHQTPNPQLSRRTLLRLTVAGLSLAPALAISSRAWAADAQPVTKLTRRPFGRAMMNGLIVRARPDVGSPQKRTLRWNDAVRIIGEATGTTPNRHNKLWYQTEDGFIYSQFVQPCENSPQQPETTIPSTGFWGEVFVPTAVVRGAPKADAGAAFRTYFGCTFQVLELSTALDGVPWYRISDGRSERLWVRADAIRRIKPAEVAPISPNVPLSDKRIDVDLRNQTTTAYEFDKPVFTARVATGARFTLEDGSRQDFSTTPGDHRIYQKTPSRRMTGGVAGDADYYDLPGISWVSYFTRSRIAFHGTYWHNDYGRPRSHGCVNLLPEDALWVYRWTLPASNYDSRWIDVPNRDDGSLVRVF